MAKEKSEALKKKMEKTSNVCSKCGSKKHPSHAHGEHKEKLRKNEGEKLNKSVEKDEEK